MKDILRIKNFKCFKSQEFALHNMTVLVGANGMGKSTVVQSLLLIRNTIENDSDIVLLNGPYGLELGTNASVINQDADDDKIVFSINSEQSEVRFSIELRGDCENERLDLRRVLQLRGDFDGILAEEFYFLSAERTGPRVSQKVVTMNFLNTGIYGEHTGQVLAKKFLKVPESRRHPSLETPYLPEHVNAWIKTILPDVEVTAYEDIKLQTSQIKIRNKRSMDFIESPNIGFGISYALPIIVEGLVAEDDRYLIVENPEAHLHPSAQTGMGKFLAMLADKGLHVVVETHSDHLLDGIQIYAAEHPDTRNDFIIYNFGQDEEKKPDITAITFDGEFDYSVWPKGFMDQTNKNYEEFIDKRTAQNV